MRYCYRGMILIFLIFSLSGCTVKQKNDDALHYAELKIIELQKQVDSLQNAELDNTELQKQVDALQNTELENINLQKQVDELKADLAKQNIAPTTSNDNLSLRIVGVDEESMRYIFVSPKHDAQSVSIVGSNVDGLVEDYEEIQWKIDNSGCFFKAEVTGSLFDFKLMAIHWDDESREFVEGEVIKEVKELRNKTVYIETNLPEGAPSHKMKWKDQSGREHELFLSYDGYGFAGAVYW